MITINSYIRILILKLTFPLDCNFYTLFYLCVINYTEKKKKTCLCTHIIKLQKKKKKLALNIMSNIH